MKDTVALRRLTLMLDTLREFFGNKSSCMEWQQHMEEYHGLGWSKASFMRRLGILKAQGCLVVIGEGTAAAGVRTSQGEIYTATGIAPAGETGSEGSQSQQQNRSQSDAPTDAPRGHEITQIGSAIPTPVLPVLRQSHEKDEAGDSIVPATVNQGGKSLAELAMQQLARLSRGK